MIDRWHQRDAQTVAVVEKALEAMASVIASTINVCDVDVVMLGGLWARFEPELIRRIERMVRPQVLAYPEVEASVLVADIVDRCLCPALAARAHKSTIIIIQIGGLQKPFLRKMYKKDVNGQFSLAQ